MLNLPINLIRYNNRIRLFRNSTLTSVTAEASQGWHGQIGCFVETRPPTVEPKNHSLCTVCHSVLCLERWRYLFHVYIMILFGLLIVDFHLDFHILRFGFTCTTAQRELRISWLNPQLHIFSSIRFIPIATDFNVEYSLFFALWFVFDPSSLEYQTT